MSESKAALKKRINELEGALVAFAPFGMCDDIEVIGIFRDPPDKIAPEKVRTFRLDTLYLDLGMFKNAAKLTGYKGVE